MWPFKKKEQKSAGKVLGLNDALSNFLLFGSASGGSASGAINLYEKSTAVSIPVNFIADAFASITPVIKQDGKIITEHPVLDLLNRPSPYYTRELFFEVLGKDFLVTNETFVTAIGLLSRPPLELQPISPRNADIPEGPQGLPSSIIISSNTLAGLYSPQRDKGSVRYIANNLTEIKQIRGYSTLNNSLLRGQSPLKQASAEVNQHILGNDHNVSMLEKGGRISLVFHFDQDLSPDEFRETKERVREQYGGASKAGEIGVTAGGKLDIKEAGTTNKDMDFAQLQAMVKQAVALQYKVPLPLVTIDSQTFNNYKEAKMALYDDAVLPLADTIFGGLTNFLMPRFGEDPTKTVITYNIDDITALAVRRNEELKLRKDLNIETDNELRTMIGREPYPEGNIIYKPANLVPAGTDIFTVDNTNIKPTAAREDEED